MLMRAADGVAPEVRSLRAAQHLDALEIEDLRVAGPDRDVELVDVHRVGELPPFPERIELVRDASDRDLLAVARAERDEAHVRHLHEHVLDAGDLLALDRRRAHRADRNRHVHHGFGASLGRHDDVLEQRVAGGGPWPARLGERRCRGDRQNGRHRDGERRRDPIRHKVRHEAVPPDGTARMRNRPGPPSQAEAWARTLVNRG
jgi:hypothetical protein